VHVALILRRKMFLGILQAFEDFQACAVREGFEDFE
jgi:hypothetical protein